MSTVSMAVVRAFNVLGPKTDKGSSQLLQHLHGRTTSRFSKQVGCTYHHLELVMLLNNRGSSGFQACGGWVVQQPRGVWNGHLREASDRALQGSASRALRGITLTFVYQAEQRYTTLAKYVGHHLAAR
jgi:hypothetical protein